MDYNFKELKNQLNEALETEFTNKDMCNTIDEDRHDLLVALEDCVNKFNAKSANWDKEVQQMTFDRICEILETAEANLSNLAFRMRKM